MIRMVPAFLISVLILSAALGVQKQKPKEEVSPDDVIRITTNLVQTDVIVTDKNDQIIPDLKLDDFEVYDNGKKQELKFMEFVGVETGRRSEGTKPKNSEIVQAEKETEPEPSAGHVKRIMAFVIDDLTIPYTDLPSVRQMLLDYVNNKMLDGDLVAIVRVVGGKGLLQQFTSDRALLRRAIASITVNLNPFMASDAPDPVKVNNPQAIPAVDSPSASIEVAETPEIYNSNDEFVRLTRGMSTLSTASFVIDSLKEIPGQKNLVIISAGIPIFEAGSTGTAFSNLTYLLNVLSDKAVRSGVVINTLDPRGLRATPGVVGFQATPARSALGGNDPNDATFGRGGALDQAIFGPVLAGASEHLGLGTVANLTGGVAVVNTNNFSAGLDKILARSKGYYELAYAPTERFDKKFHKIEIKVKREGIKVYHHVGYLAVEDKTSQTPKTKEQLIAAAALSPLKARDIDVTPNISLKLANKGAASVDIHMLIDPKKLNLVKGGNGNYAGSLDIVGFVFDQMGRQRGGFSETVTLDLTESDYQKAMRQGLTYSASTQLPAGYYQIRSVVRETSTGSVGTFSKYLEIPDLSKGKLAVSSIFLFALDSATSTNPIPLLGSRILNRRQELRYALTVYNAKIKDGVPQAKAQMIISQAGNVLFKEPEENIKGNSEAATKLGQLGLSKVAPGRYVLTVIITDAVDAKNRVVRSIDFTVD